MDEQYAQPWADLEATRSMLQKSAYSWHFLELPEEPGKPRRFVATGHIPCFDCDLCAEQGDVRFSDIAPIPWRAFYGDCTDFQDDPEEATSP